MYSGPGKKGVAGARSFAKSRQVTISRVLDFLPDQSWDAITKADWLLDAYQGSGYQLELSVPMLPRDPAVSLEKCASGAYNTYWQTLARKMQSAGLGTSTVRPGWEANGSWYAWSARGHEQAYVGCFRSLVSSMRAEAPALTFSWSMSNGTNAVLADRLWPGDGYVDIVGIDVYDYDWYWYPKRQGKSLRTSQRNAWDSSIGGPSGLAHWSAFAREHSKPLALSEWGLAWRADGHGGGDNSEFVKGLASFVSTTSNGVAYATYFNNQDNPVVAHNITAKNHRFPKASREVVEMMRR